MCIRDRVTPPHDTSIMAEVAKVTSFDQVKTMDKAAAIEAGLYLSLIHI